MWVDFAPYADSNFQTEIANDFPQRYWEMYLACSLIHKGFTIKSAPSGPDVGFEHNAETCWIEAVAPKPGVGADAVPEVKYDGVARFVPDEQVILRLCNAFDNKYKQYSKYLANGRIGPNDPYVIGISGAAVPHSQFDSSDIPYIVSAVLPFGGHFVVFDKKTMKIVDQGVQHRPGIMKASGKVVPTTYFEDPTYAGVSAVLYSRPTVWAIPRLELGQLTYLVHNPHAANPLPRTALPVEVEFWMEDDQLKRHEC